MGCPSLPPLPDYTSRAADPAGPISQVEAVSAQQTLQQCWSRLFRRLDMEVLQMSAASGKMDGTTALAGVHARSSLFVAHAGKEDGGPRVFTVS